jgi:hypothetical protein
VIFRYSRATPWLARFGCFCAPFCNWVKRARTLQG